MQTKWKQLIICFNATTSLDNNTLVWQQLFFTHFCIDSTPLGVESMQKTVKNWPFCLLVWHECTSWCEFTIALTKNRFRIWEKRSYSWFSGSFIPYPWNETYNKRLSWRDNRLSSPSGCRSGAERISSTASVLWYDDEVWMSRTFHGAHFSLCANEA